jgi:hypothetical protein
MDGDIHCYDTKDVYSSVVSCPVRLSVPEYFFHARRSQRLTPGITQERIVKRITGIRIPDKTSCGQGQGTGGLGDQGK